MNKKNVQNLFYLAYNYYYFWNIIIVFLFILWQISFTEILFCDSINESFVDNVTNLDTVEFNEDNTQNHLSYLSIKLKYQTVFKRKVHWYFHGKFSGNFVSYEDFKKTWNPDNSLCGELRTTFEEIRENPLTFLRKISNNTTKKAVLRNEEYREMDLAHDQYRRNKHIAQMKKLDAIARDYHNRKG